MKDGFLLDIEAVADDRMMDLGAGLRLRMSDLEEWPPKAVLYRHGTYIRAVDLSDRTAERVFVVEAVEMGAKKSRLAEAMGLSRQTIDNWLAVKAKFGLEGLVHSYRAKPGETLAKQRKAHAGQLPRANKNTLVAEERRKAREQAKKAEHERQRGLNFSFGPSAEACEVAGNEQLFAVEHDWKASRYAGVFMYLVALVSECRWLELVMGHFGGAYRIFMVFLLMAARNIRSIEQLKNVRGREAAAVLGLKRLAQPAKIREWFHEAARKRISELLKLDYFRYRIKAGLVGVWLWFTDGHLLPYSGSQRVRWAYNTQRRMPMPGRTNMVTCDAAGRVVDFDIQEGKGDLRARIVAVAEKWREDVGECPVQIFDREGTGAEFFSSLVRRDMPFVTWKKNVDAKAMAAIADERFNEQFELNGREYAVFEDSKSFSFTLDECEPDAEKYEDRTHTFALRQIQIWNKTSGRRTAGLAWTGKRDISTLDCAHAILSRWGASENAFKHISERHPFHYHPGFELVESDRQDIANPEIKEKEKAIARVGKALSKLYKRLAKTPEILNKDGSPRANSTRVGVQRSIEKLEADLERMSAARNALPARVDVSCLENYKSFKRIDNEGKNLFDFVTASVWNARKYMVDCLAPYLGKQNEVIDLFYAITDCHGWVKNTKTEVIVRLEPLPQPRRRRAQQQLCRKLTGLCAQLPTGKWLTVEVGDSPL